jgi:hypothetical protein
MYIRYTALTATFAASLLGVVLSTQASASCSFQDEQPAPAQKPQYSGLGQPHFIRTAFTQVEDWDSVNVPIVGLWKFEMLAKSTSTNTNPMPDGTLIDFGTAAWHSDGTELMNSGARNPVDGDFCQGVWAQVSGSTFILNHYALAWTNGTYTGPANITERVTVDRKGRNFSGTFKLVQYLATVTPGHEFDQSTALVSITGTITGIRVTAN